MCGWRWDSIDTSGCQKRHRGDPLAVGGIYLQAIFKPMCKNPNEHPQQLSWKKLLFGFYFHFTNTQKYKTISKAKRSSLVVAEILCSGLKVFSLTKKDLPRISTIAF